MVDFVALQWLPADLKLEVQQGLTDLAEHRSSATVQRLLHSHRPVTMGEAELDLNELGPIAPQLSALLRRFYITGSP